MSKNEFSTVKLNVKHLQTANTIRLVANTGKAYPSPFQLVIIPKETYHQFLNKADGDYHRSVFGFYDIPEF
ncbi:MAG: hypothetical protein IJ428_02530 [Clostridia bacterium]|nr:hypothetical protein [Clostridia bacterium]